MIRVLPPALDSLGQYGLDLLLDAARLLRVEDGTAPVVDLHLTDARYTHGLQPDRAGRWGIEPGDGRVLVPRDLIAAVAAGAGAVAEQQSTAVDRRGRVPSRVNTFVREGLSDRPVVSQIGDALRRAAAKAAGNRPFATLAPWPAGRSWAAAITHDVDVLEWWPLFTALRMAELSRKGHFRSAARVAAHAAGATFSRPPIEGMKELVALEGALGIRATWFFLCETPTPRSIVRGDATYRPEGRVARRAIELVLAARGEIGLHGSFETAALPELHARQRARLQELTGEPVLGVRQHFLRLRPGRTHRSMVAAEFLYDASLGFPDRGGFRLGHAEVAPVWDDEAVHTLPLEAVPLVWMDRALSKYQGIEQPDVWIDEALRLAAACRAVQGLWVGLWHPNLIMALGYPDALEAYRRLVESLAVESPWFCTLTEAVQWRRARRTVRATHVGEDGRVVLRMPEQWSGEIPLHGADGRPL